MLQFLVCLFTPVQCLPLYAGGGLVQVLVRYCDPVPHGLEQAHHLPHGLQPPLTANNQNSCRLVSTKYVHISIDLFGSALAGNMGIWHHLVLTKTSQSKFQSCERKNMTSNRYTRICYLPGQR